MQENKQLIMTELPKYTDGILRGRTDWLNTSGHKVKFMYHDMEFQIYIVKVYKNNKDETWLTIKYNDNITDISVTNFLGCKFIKFLGVSNIPKWKYKIGQIIKDSKRDLTIINRKIIPKTITLKNGKKSVLNEKYYKYHCNICEFDGGRHYSCKKEQYFDEYWILESSLNRGTGCTCCCLPPHIVVEHINSIVTTDKWMIPYFQGGYNEAKLYTKGSNKTIYPICPDCGRIKNKLVCVNSIYCDHTIGCICSDNIPFGEKIMFSVLEQLNLNFQTQLSNTTFDWCKDYKYDFYLKFDDTQYIMEINGSQHYEENTNFEMSLDEVENNDKSKKQLALQNGIKEENYIVIDCRYSTLDFIKQKILESDFSKVFDLNNINWEQCLEFASSSLVKKVCLYKYDNEVETLQEIAKIFKLSLSTISKYLTKGNEIWDWCKYDKKETQIKNSIINGKVNSKQVEIFENEVSKGVFPSVAELSRVSETLFNIKLLVSGIGAVCLGKLKQYKGYTFKYI